MVNQVFYWCVELLSSWAKILGISYELINIIIFIIGYPLFVLLLFIVIFNQRKRIKKLKFPYDIYGLRIIYNDSYNYYNKDFAYVIKNILYDNYYTLGFIYDDYINIY